jgi:hypothetical protein
MSEQSEVKQPPEDAIDAFLEAFLEQIREPVRDLIYQRDVASRDATTAVAEAREVRKQMDESWREAHVAERIRDYRGRAQRAIEALERIEKRAIDSSQPGIESMARHGITEALRSTIGPDHGEGMEK